MGDVTMHECSATYAGNACGCAIDENFCLSLDCSLHLEGAVTEACQELRMDGEATVFLPRFKMFDPNFKDTKEIEGEDQAENNNGAKSALLGDASAANFIQLSAAGGAVALFAQFIL
jgi:hypothetical protein